METFAELLTAYMDRTGIGDAELARRIPVSRPTLVRWKEGITTRPRYREDVVRCAELLRLTPEETDEFLLAAGFAPETAPAQPPAVAEDEPLAQAPPLVEDVGESRPAEDGTESGGFVRRHRRFLIAGVIVPLVVIAAAAIALSIRMRDTTVYPVAADGEALIVLAPFVNYTAGGQGFNVVGRLSSAINDEVVEAGLQSVRTVKWPRIIEAEVAAADAARRSRATLVIWGEYDSGRVMARFTAPNSQLSVSADQIVDIASTPAELPATINIGLAEEVRYIALMTLGQIFMEHNRFDQAKTALIRALDPPPPDPAVLASLRFLLGRAYMGGDLADFDEAVWLFTQVLTLQPNSVEALNSRALAYLERSRPGDTELALADLNRASTMKPGRAATNLNLAVAYMERGADGDLDRALDSLSQALEADPDYASAYVNRASIYMESGTSGDLDRAFDDIEKALEIDPKLSSAYVARGNALLARGSVGDLEQAAAEYSRAIGLAPDSPVAYFNRALVHSGLSDLNASVLDLRRAHELGPLESMYARTLCWQMAVSGDASDAVYYCDRAVATDESGLPRDSRGLANALIGRTDDAIVDFETFLAWVDTSPKDTCRTHYRPSRTEWVEMLREGGNPFHPDLLRDLRVRPTAPGTEPC